VVSAPGIYLAMKSRHSFVPASFLKVGSFGSFR
jgi:hypothetical protein